MTTPSDVTASDQHAETWTPLPPPFSKYEWSPDGFGPDQRPVRRAGAATGLATTVSNSGYLQVKPYDDNGRRQTVPVHQLILLGGTGVPCPPGQESRHLDDDPLNNRWRPGATDDEVRANSGNLVRGTKKQNTADKAANGRPAVVPRVHKCVEHGRECEGMVVHEGSRCRPCMVRAGERAGVLLAGGWDLLTVTRRLGYKNPERMHELAVKFGGYAGSYTQALAQRPRWTRRASATLRGLIWGDGS